MASSLIIFLLVSFLLFAPRVSSDDQTFWEAFYAKPPVRTPTLPAKPPVKTPTLPAKPPVKTPTLPVPVHKAPAPAPTKAPAPAPVMVLPPVNVKECPRLCSGRCKLHSRIRQCSRVCITCCERCKCVPPGTYGNKLMCGKCYAEMKTHGNKFKCP